MVVIKKIEVTIRVDGQDLHEYNDSIHEPRGPTEQTRYIEFSVFLDGRYVDNFLWDSEDECDDIIYDGISNEDQAEWHTKPLMFSNITSEDLPDLASFRTQKSAVTEMGTIAVKVFRGIKQSEVTQSTEAYEKLDSETKFAKKLLEGKTLSHRISHGEAERAEVHKVFEVFLIDTLTNPFAVFEFNYRSKKSLQHLLLIPRSPSPIPLERRPLESLTVAEKDTLIEKLKARVEVIELKDGRELQDKSGGNDAETPELMEARPKKRRRLHKVIVIDSEDERA